LFGFCDPFPVGLHFKVYISLLWSFKFQTKLSDFSFHIFAVQSSEHDANKLPLGSHLIALTSSSWPLNFFTGFSSPKLHTKIVLSDEHVAKVFSPGFQSTSKVGPECNL